MFLELNPNCGVFYPPGPDGASADAVLRLDPLGHLGTNAVENCSTYKNKSPGFTKAIIAAALARQTQRAPVRRWHDAATRQAGLRMTAPVVQGATVMVLDRLPRWHEVRRRPFLSWLGCLSSRYRECCLCSWLMAGGGRCVTSQTPRVPYTVWCMSTVCSSITCGTTAGNAVVARRALSRHEAVTIAVTEGQRLFRIDEPSPARTQRGS